MRLADIRLVVDHPRIVAAVSELLADEVCLSAFVVRAMLSGAQRHLSRPVAPRYEVRAERATVATHMKHVFTAVFERDGAWHVAYCPEIPGANGQGRTQNEARDSLRSAIELILEDRLEDGLRGLPEDAIRETVILE